MDIEMLHRETKQAIEKVRAEYARLIERTLAATARRQKCDTGSCTMPPSIALNPEPRQLDGSEE